MHPHHAYRRSRAESWTRIEMLLDIYDACVASLSAGTRVLRDEGPSQLAPQHRLAAQQRLLLLLEGVTSRDNPTAQPMQQLLSACVQWCGESDAVRWEAALNIVEQLRGAFLSIRDEAVQLERTGVIPPLDWRSTAIESIA